MSETSIMDARSPLVDCPCRILTPIIIAMTRFITCGA